VKRSLVLAAAIYLAAVFAECLRVGVTAHVLPAPLTYFAQIAGLYTAPATVTLEYRAEGWFCRERAWREIDVAPEFPSDADHKENRFYRAMHFYGERQKHVPTLRALDDFLVNRYDARSPGARIGGVRFVKVRIPFGKPGDGSARYQKKPLGEYPKEERRTMWITPEATREERCRSSG
jgi:hypothetical protein